MPGSVGMMPDMFNRLFLLDGMALIYRAHFALMKSPIFNSKGHNTSAMYGFTNTLLDILANQHPTHLAIALDTSEPTGRHILYPQYKAQRDEMPEDIREAIPAIERLAAAFNIPLIKAPGYEADDIIGTLATRMRGHGLRATIVTRDKDLSQLVREGDCFWDFAAGQRYGYADLEERFGARPERMADYLALTGDGVDNIPGVPGVGPRTAAAIFRHFESLDHLYDDIEAAATLPVRGAATLPAKLREHRGTAYLARSLTTIACDMPLACTPAMLEPRAPDLAALEAFYDAANFGPGLRRQAVRLAARG